MTEFTFKENGKAIRKVIKTEIESPVCLLKHSSLVEGYTYPNSSQKRYQATLALDPEFCEEFIRELQGYQKDQKVDDFLKPLYSYAPNGDILESGIFMMNFVSKEPPQIFEYSNGKEKPHKKLFELPLNSKAKIIFDIVSYFDKKNEKYKFTFPIKKVVFYKS